MNVEIPVRSIFSVRLTSPNLTVVAIDGFDRWIAKNLGNSKFNKLNLTNRRRLDGLESLFQVLSRF